MRTQGCRDMIDWVEQHCHGLSKDGIASVKAASKFCKERAPYLELQSTRSVNMIRTIQDPIVQGDVLKMVKTALETKVDPRTGESLHNKNLVGAITTPMVAWMIEYAETGVKPAYVRRGSAKTPELDISELATLLDELMRTKEDKRTGDYVLTRAMMEKIKGLYSKVLLPQPKRGLECDPRLCEKIRPLIDACTRT